MQNDEDPPIRLILAALFLAARIVEGSAYSTREARVTEAVKDADELVRQAGPK